jgi:DNA-binding NarL/FixJ family response regulator
VLKQLRHGDIVNAVRRVASGEVLFEDSLRANVLDRLDGEDESHSA